jgi:hypothetical protein
MPVRASRVDFAADLAHPPVRRPEPILAMEVCDELLGTGEQPVRD